MCNNNVGPELPTRNAFPWLYVVAATTPLIAVVATARSVANVITTCATRLDVKTKSTLPLGWRLIAPVAPGAPVHGRASWGDYAIHYDVEEGTTPHTTSVREMKLTDGTSCPAAEIDLAPYTRGAELESLFRGGGSNIQHLRLRTLSGSAAVLTYFYPGGTTDELFVVAVESSTTAATRTLRASVSRAEVGVIGAAGALAIATAVAAVLTRRRPVRSRAIALAAIGVALIAFALAANLAARSR